LTPTIDFNMRAHLELCVDYILASQIDDPNSPFIGGFNLFYDFSARTFRAPHWTWTWGPAIAALIGSAERSLGRAADARSAALAAGRASLRQVVPAEHKLAGLLTVRRDIDPLAPLGHWSKISVADSGFLAGWGWAPLAQSGHDEFRAALDSYSQAVELILAEHQIVPQDFVVEQDIWSPSTLDEALIGVEGLAAGFANEPSAAALSRLHRYVDPIVEKLARVDGLLQRGWRHRDGHVIPNNGGTKDAGWVVEGLLAAHRVDPSAAYLSRARLIADLICDQQLEDGSWPVFLESDPRDVGVDEKGTAIWAYLLFVLSRITGDHRYHEHAFKALAWLIAHQDRHSSTREGGGGVPGRSVRSGIMYREWFSLSCLYTVSFFALALLEALDLEDSSEVDRL